MNMNENNNQNNLQNTLIECPRCHIKLNRKEMNLHNIKCRKLVNQLEKNSRKNTNEKLKNIIPKDEYKDFMDKIKSTEIDDKNIKTLIKNFILIFGNKIELLENNIKEINSHIKNLNEENALYFKRINDSLDNINKRYYKKRERYKKKGKDYKMNNNKSYILYKNDTDINIFKSKKNDNNNKQKINKNKNDISPFSIIEKEDIKEKSHSFYTKKNEKKQYMSEKNIININKEIISQFNDNNDFNINKKYRDYIKRVKKKNNKYKEKKLKTKNNFNDTIYKYNNNTLNILTEDNIINHTSSNAIQFNLRRSLSFGDLNKISNTQNNHQNEKNYNGGYYDDYNTNDIVADSLDIIMEKISNLEETLINFGLNNDEDFKEKLFNIKSKEFEYSNSDSYHSDNSKYI